MAISEAHEILSDPDKRRSYDQEQNRGHAAAGHHRGSGGWPGNTHNQGPGYYRRVLRRRPVMQRFRDAYGRIFARQTWQTYETYEWVSEDPTGGATHDQHGRKRQTGSVLEYILQELMVMMNDPAQMLLLVFAILGVVALAATDGDREEASTQGEADRPPTTDEAELGPVQRAFQGHAPNVPPLSADMLTHDSARILVLVPVVGTAAAMQGSLAVLRAVQSTAASLATHQRASKLHFVWVDMSGGSDMKHLDNTLHAAAVEFLRLSARHLAREEAASVTTCADSEGNPVLGSVWVAHLTVLHPHHMQDAASVVEGLARSARKVAAHRLEGGEQGSHHQAGHNLKEWLLQLLEGVNWYNVSGGLLASLIAG